MSALDRAEQDGEVFPESMRTLQAELRALDPLISEAESVMVRQAGQGVLRASAYQKAALAPALLETAGKSERFAYEKLGAEQRERVGLQKVRLVPDPNRNSNPNPNPSPNPKPSRSPSLNPNPSQGAPVDRVAAQGGAGPRRAEAAADRGARLGLG